MASEPKWKSLLKDKVRSVYPQPDRNPEKDSKLEDFLKQTIAALNAMKHEPEDQKWFWRWKW